MAKKSLIVWGCAAMLSGACGVPVDGDSGDLSEETSTTAAENDATTGASPDAGGSDGLPPDGDATDDGQTTDGGGPDATGGEEGTGTADDDRLVCQPSNGVLGSFWLDPWDWESVKGRCSVELFESTQARRRVVLDCDGTSQTVSFTPDPSSDLHFEQGWEIDLDYELLDYVAGWDDWITIRATENSGAHGAGELLVGGFSGTSLVPFGRPDFFAPFSFEALDTECPVVPDGFDCGTIKRTAIAAGDPDDGHIVFDGDVTRLPTTPELTLRVERARPYVFADCFDTGADYVGLLFPHW